MSSLYVRDTLKDFLETNAPTEQFVDLTARFEELRDLLAEENVPNDGPWVGLEFIGGDETPITVGSNNTQGYYREDGAVYIHVVGIVGLGNARTVLERAEVLRNLVRGQRFGRIVIDGVSPANTDSGSTFNFEGGYFSASFLISYEHDFHLGAS